MIDFGRPFQHAYDHTVGMLFKPFDAGKWFSLGFTAWLASFLAGGNGANFNYGGNDFNSNSTTEAVDKSTSELFAKMLALGLPVWLMVLALIALVVCLVVLVLVFLGCRGQFMFLDNVIHGRYEVARPWKEFKEEADELTFWYAIFSLVPLAGIFVFLGFALAHFWQDILTQTTRSFVHYLPWMLGLLLIVLLFLPLALFTFFLREFGVPYMAKHRCSFGRACESVWFLVVNRPADCLVFLMLRMAMGMAFIFISLFACCFTCCLALLPYLGTVVTLPYPVFRQTFTLDCLAQFGPEYNLWPVSPAPPLKS